MSLVVRTAPEPSGMAPAIAREIRALRADLPIAEVRTMEEVLAQSLATTRFSTLLLVLFSAVALLLATVGVYGVISCNVAARTHEIGIRMALGAQRRDVILMVTRRAGLLSLTGVVLGLLAALAFSRMLGGLLYGVAAHDAGTFAAVPCVLLIVALAASYFPARRAAGVNPLDALRRE
jgi:putative ABC transport system permease protein